MNVDYDTLMKELTRRQHEWNKYCKRYQKYENTEDAIQFASAEGARDEVYAIMDVVTRLANTNTKDPI